MCGIFGHYKRNGADEALVERMAHCLDHRGPDGYSIHHAGTLAFGAGRLAIIDLAANPGVIFSEDRRVSVAFNGEIYNYKALRAELEKLGHHFATQTDTEVIVHGYESWGDDVISHLRGMFAVALWDESNTRLLLARDRLGKKPLYYTQLEDGFLFASEIKALYEYPGLKRAVNDDALLNYLTLGYVPAPHTMFQGIDKLFPGELLTLDPNGIHKRRYWQPTLDTLQPMDYDQAVRQVRDLLTEVVEMRLMSDVPIGAYLSGGLDSTAVVAIMSRALNQPVNTFTVGFGAESGSQIDNKFNVDARFASLAAERLKTNHHAITIPQDERLAWLLPHLIYAMDEPVAQQSIFQTPYVAALARQNGVPVLLTGDGGDELFAGYPHFKSDQVLERYLKVPGLLRNAILNPILERLPSDSARKLAHKSRQADPVRRYLAWKRMIELERLPELLADEWSAERAYPAVSAALLPMLQAGKTRHFADHIALTGLASWLAEDSNMRVDKMSMLMSTEARAPFEDHHLVDLAFRIPLAHKLRNGDFKTVLKSAVSDLVPQEILERPKWGFAPPTSQWLRTHLRPLVKTYLAPERVEAVGFFRPETVVRLIESHIDKGQYEVWPLWTLLVFHIWHALYIERSLVLDHKLTPAELLGEAVVHTK